MKKKSLKLLHGSFSDTLTDLLRNGIAYIIVVGGVWLVLGLIGLIFNPSAGFNSLFNQEKAFLFSALALIILITRQKIGENLSAVMNVIAAEIIAFAAGTGLTLLLLNIAKIKVRESDLISLLIFAAIRYIFIQAYFDKAIVRKSNTLYEQFAKIRRINPLTIFASLTIFMVYAVNRHPKFADVAAAVLFEIALTVIIISTIKRRTKKRRILPEYFTGTERIVLDVDLTELCRSAYLHKRELINAKADLKTIIGEAGYGFSDKTLILNLDTYIFCKKIIPDVNKKSILIHIRKDIESYGLHSDVILRKMVELLVSDGFDIYFQVSVTDKSRAHTEFEDIMTKSCVFLNKEYRSALETVINGGGEYSQKCSEHISRQFSGIYSRTPSTDLLCNTVRSQLYALMSEYSLLDMFYELIQTVEMCVHLTCLCALNENTKIDYGSVERLALGTMVGITKRYTSNKKIGDEELKKSVLFISELCGLGSGGTVNEDRVFDIIVQLRNRYLGHGTMTYSVSEELVYNLTTVSSYVTGLCCDLLSERFKETDLISAVIPFTKAKSAVIVENEIYFYSSHIEDEKAEYINPLTGQLYQNCKYRVISTCMNEENELKGDEQNEE